MNKIKYKKRMALCCVDYKNRCWTIEYVSFRNFHHIVLWKLFPKLSTCDGDGIFQPKYSVKTLMLRII